MPFVALVSIATAWIPRVRDWLGIVVPILASAAFIAALLTTQSGEALATQVDQAAAVSAHTGIADVPVAGAFLLLAGTWAQWVWLHFFVRPRPDRLEPRVTRPGLAGAVSLVGPVLLSLVGVFAIIAIVVVGDMGARAVWE